MTEPRILDLADAIRQRDPAAVGVWNRLEGRPRATDFDRALRAEVRDPLWMLTRQWQMGEFRGSDAGSPVTATYAVSATPPTRFRPFDGTAEPIPDGHPLESMATRRLIPFAFGAEPIAFDLRLIIGRRWLKLLDQNIGDLQTFSVFRAQYLQLYPIALPDPNADSDTPRVADAAVWATLQAVANRWMDGYLLYQHLTGGGHASDNIIDEQNLWRGKLDQLGTRLVTWFDNLIDQPTAPTAAQSDGDTTWDPRRLEHRFSVAATAPDGTETTLTAPEYPGGELDWHTFSADPGASLGGTGPGPQLLNRTVFPAPIRYSGMPLPRWWAIEDGKTNFAAVRPDSTDLARLIFLEFALVYSNDWYQLPCDLPAGTLATIQGLAKTDVFGQRLWITPASTGTGVLPWAMFTLDTIGSTTPSGNALLLPLTVPQVADGPALEEVALIRDENVNLVWGIEHTVRLPTGEPRRGSEVAAEALAHRLRLHPPPLPDPSRAPLAYQTMNAIPEHWIPFIPVHVPGDNRTIQLQRAAMPSIVDGTPIRPPRTTLLREGLDAARAYFINEEEVPQTGTRLTLAYHRTRRQDGRIIVWLGTRRGTGRGESSSGLAFDLLINTTAQSQP